MMQLLNDVRLALRSFYKRPAFTATVVATLALGIGATTTVFSVIHGVMLRPLPYADPDRLVNVYRISPDFLANTSPATLLGGDFTCIPPAIVSDWQASARVFDAIGGFMRSTLTARIGAEPETLQVGMVTSGVFKVLGVRPLLGDVLTEADDRIGAPGRVVLSHGFWQNRCGSDPGVIGRLLMSGTMAYTVAGVMPQGFGFPNGNEDLWMGLGDDRRSFTSRKSGFLQVIARLKSGVSLTQARDEMRQLSAALAREHPEDKPFVVGVLPQTDVVSGKFGRSLLLLFAAVGAVLLIGAANVANLLLIRATERRREIGLCQALGAPCGRLIVGSLTESVVLAMAGGLAGCVIATTSVRAIIRRLPFALPRASEIQVDSRVLLFGLALSLAVGVLVGVLPALRATGASVLDALRDGGRCVAGGRRRSRVQMALVVTQVALVVVLLTVTGLFIRSLGELDRIDMGFSAAHVLTVNASVPWSQLPADARTRDDQARAFLRELTGKLAAIPGVEAVGAAGHVPTFGWSSPQALIETAGGQLRFNAHSTVTSPGFFAAMGIPLVAGRTFTEDDRDGTQPVAVVSQAFVRRFWPAESPIGRRLKIDTAPGSAAAEPWMTVVGVVGDVRFSPGREPMPTIYMAHAQQPWPAMIVAVKTAIASSSIAQAARGAVRAMNPDMVVRSFVLSDRIRQDPTMVSRRFATQWLGALTAIAVVMALLGIYGLLAYTVAQRTHEIGVRIALGASRSSVIRGVMRQGMLMAAMGLASGCVCTMVAIRTIRAMLVVSPTDPATLAAVAALVPLVVAAASFVPARRATKVDPMLALRSE